MTLSQRFDATGAFTIGTSGSISARQLEDSNLPEVLFSGADEATMHNATRTRRIVPKEDLYSEKIKCYSQKLSTLHTASGLSSKRNSAGDLHKKTFNFSQTKRAGFTGNSPAPRAAQVMLKPKPPLKERKSSYQPPSVSSARTYYARSTSRDVSPP